MNYDEIVAGLIQQSLVAISVSSHERIVLSRYTTDQARPIVERLLSGATQATVGLTEDNGTITEVELPAARWSPEHKTIEVVPFVVAENPVAGDPAWVGSQGFASRLRTSFHQSVDPCVIRVLVLFDARPVETEQTTASESLAAAMDSVEALIAWFESPSWRSGFATAVYDTAMQVVAWWRDWVRGNPRWNILPHHKQLEQAATFMEACRPCSSASEVGQQLPHLGPLFKDPEFLLDGRVDRRLEKNAELGSTLDGIRRQRTLDPLLEADQVVDLGPPGDAFHDRMAEGLRDPDLQITQRDLTYAEINERLRSRERCPAWLDVSGTEVVALNSDGSPEGESLPWRLLDDVDSPPNGDGSAEVVIPCPTSAVRITIPIEGDLRSFVYRDGSFVADAGDDEGGLKPGTQLVLDFDRPDPFSVTEFLVREKRPGPGRPPRPTQFVRVSVVAGDRMAVPEASTLDAEANAFVVDGAADSLRVQVGGAELRVTDGLPPEDGRAVEVEIDRVEFRWRGEDRSPPVDPDPAPRAHLRLLELIAVRQSGDPGNFRPYFLEGGELGATCRSSGSLDVIAQWMDEEAALLLHPERFVGIDGDLDAATSEIRAVAAGALNAWMHARTAFFEAAREQCERILPGIGGQRPSMYLVDLREEELSELAREYSRTYAVLVETISQSAHAAANRAVIEPVLLCDRGPSADDAIRIAPTHPSAVALLASIQRGLLSTPWADTGDRNALDELLEATSTERSASVDSVAWTDPGRAPEWSAAVAVLRHRGRDSGHLRRTRASGRAEGEEVAESRAAPQCTRAASLHQYRDWAGDRGLSRSGPAGPGTGQVGRVLLRCGSCLQRRRVGPGSHSDLRLRAIWGRSLVPGPPSWLRPSVQDRACFSAAGTSRVPHGGCAVGPAAVLQYVRVTPSGSRHRVRWRSLPRTREIRC